MHRALLISTVIALFLAGAVSPVFADIPDDCDLDTNTLLGIRQMLTAEDNGDFSYWTPEELACACITLYYADPVDDDFNERVAAGAVVLLGMTEDPRAVPVLIDAIDTHPAQALYNLGNFPTVESLTALTENIRNEDDEARENAAEGLRRMPVPNPDDVSEEWVEALETAIGEVSDWIPEEPEPWFREYFEEAYDNLTALHESATQAVSGVE